ncbi:Acyltransferase 3 [Altererythrobacter epoxidivorans]|uniref:Acyltransferase 3 n=1 Tax=Altererythrobacter epoxidivorans TaxID=361183 RepID=A0A0M5L6Z4_9SPHN|nr:acyltransferase [Altererythrobacter epoxidivorans]ALE16819.1 Acyltransferase 3 [Altererythrobacter epoxidivorans]
MPGLFICRIGSDRVLLTGVTGGYLESLSRTGIEMKTPYLSLIDGFRGLAALCVLIYHYGHFFMAGPDRTAIYDFPDIAPFSDALSIVYSEGDFAVQIFWMISGFVFTYVYPAQIKDGRAFLVNRIARLYPLHLVTLILVTALFLAARLTLGYTPIYANFDLEHFLAQLVLASDWVNTGYSFNGPIWSVSVEVVIYGVFWALSSRLAHQNALISAVFAAGFFALFMTFGNLTEIFRCGFFFFSGAMLARMCLGLTSRIGMSALAVLLITEGLVFSAYFGVGGFKTLGGVGLFGGMLVALYAFEGAVPERFRRVSEWLGESSYGLYLWHFPIQLSAILIIGPSGQLEVLAQSPAFFFSYLAISLFVARLSYRYFEAPARRYLRRALA